MNERLFVPHHLLLLSLELLLGELLLRGLLLGSLGHGLLLLGEDQLDVARRRHVGIDATVGTVCAATQAGSTVHLDVLNDQTINVQALVVGIGLGVLEELQQELGRLLGPTSLCRLPLLGLRASAHSSVVAAEWHALLLLHDVLQEALGTTQRHALDGVSSLERVLKGEGKWGLEMSRGFSLRMNSP